MRRSSAPSQLGGLSAKRARLGQETENLNCEQSNFQVVPSNSCVQSEPSVSTAVPIRVPTFGAKQKPQFRPPLTQITPTHQSPRAADVVPSESQSDNCNYFNVMWCKASKKKHKKWEGDAVLSTRGRCVVLYDMDGKDIGRGSGYKAAMLASLLEEQTLFVGGKEVQIMGTLSTDEFKSGKCFLGQADVSEDPSTTTVTRVIAKPFVNPQKAGSISTQQSIKPAAPIPSGCMFDAAAPDALVMPRPSQSHQWQHNKQGLAVVDVVVDPHISFCLRPHQRDGITFLYECVLGMRNFMGTGAILADDMGLGKTLQCIALIWTLLKQGPYNGKAVIKKVLIITPGSLVKNWKQEFNKWLGSERLSVFAVGQDNRVEAFTQQNISRILIISYEMFVRSVDLLSSLNFDLVICDEGHRLKNTNIKTTSLIMSLATRRRLVLTGTPIQNDLQEFYSIVEFVNPGVLGSSATFHHVFESAIVAARQPEANSEQIRIGEERATELTRLTKLFVLRRNQDINNEYLPPKLDLVLFCRPTSLQLALYNHLLSSRLIRSCLEGHTDGAPHLMCIAALKKLCNHPALMYEKANEIENDATLDIQEQSIYRGLFNAYPSSFLDSPCDRCHSGKLIVLAALLRGIYHSRQKERVVLVSNHTQTLDLLQQFCICEGYGFLRLDGQTPTGQRQDIVKRFNSPYAQEFVFLLSSKAGGVGLNLIGASRLVLYDIDWNPANDMQAMARVWRDGQKKTVHIYRLITTGTIEEKMYQRQISKQGLCGAVMEKHTKKDVQFSLDDLRDLFSLNETTACDTHDLLSCTCDCAENGHHDTTSKPAKTSAVRSCQLGAAAQHPLQRSLTMDELLDWHHVRITGQESLPESWCLSGSQETISYIFWNENKGRQLSVGDT